MNISTGLDVPGQFLDEFARVDGVEFHGKVQGLRASSYHTHKQTIKNTITKVKHNSIGKKRKTKYLKFKKSKKKKWIIKNNVRDKWSVRRIVHTQYDYYTTNFFPFSRPLVF
jgi:hypothetical protein